EEPPDRAQLAASHHWFLPIPSRGRDELRPAAIAGRRHPRARRVAGGVAAIEQDSLAVRREAVAAGCKGEVPAAADHVIRVDERRCDLRVVCVQREPVGCERSRALGVGPPENPSVGGPARDKRELYSAQRPEKATELPVVPGPDPLVPRRAAWGPADRSPECERTVRAPRERSGAPAGRDHLTGVAAAPQEDGAGPSVRLVRGCLPARRPDELRRRKRRTACDSPAVRDEPPVAAPTHRPWRCVCHCGRLLSGAEIKHDEAVALEKRDPTGPGRASCCTGDGDREKHQRDCEATHAASILTVWRRPTAAKPIPASR